MGHDLSDVAVMVPWPYCCQQKCHPLGLRQHSPGQVLRNSSKVAGPHPLFHPVPQETGRVGLQAILDEGELKLMLELPFDSWDRIQKPQLNQSDELPIFPQLLKCLKTKS